jgi:hypothetical protein
MKMKTSAAFVAVATIAVSLAATPASAQRGAVTAPGYYYYYGSDYVSPPACQWATQRFWDGHGWRVRRVRVCG